MKLCFTEQDELQLLMGTSCGRLLIYKKIESKCLEASCVSFSAHPIIDIVIPSFRNTVFALAENGTIYLVGIRDFTVHYQFQCSLPMIEDKRLSIFMDDLENYICCAYGHGRIIVWEISEKMKIQFAEQY
jgi:hypothetical protein